MTLTELFLEDLDREGDRCRKALEQVPDGQFDWKPHERSMIFGYLAMMVAVIPDWIAMEIRQPDLDLAPKDGSGFKPEAMRTRAEYLRGLDRALTAAREALRSTTDEHLMKPWRLLVGGATVWEGPRYVMVRDTFSHLAHHRGQMTVYLRLMGAKVPALYGPSADEQSF
jgi:uncharacterized damage-inducible protein DinB